MFLFQIKAVFLTILNYFRLSTNPERKITFHKIIQQHNYFNIDMKNCFLNIRMISEGSWENSALPSAGINYILKCFQIGNHKLLQ